MEEKLFDEEIEILKEKFTDKIGISDVLQWRARNQPEKYKKLYPNMDFNSTMFMTSNSKNSNNSNNNNNNNNKNNYSFSSSEDEGGSKGGDEEKNQ